MAYLARRSQNRTDIWPGFVDALATLLMVIIFLLMIFVIAQFFLGEALSGRDQALDRLRSQVTELADLLNLERKTNADLRKNVAQLSDELSVSVATRDDLVQQLKAITLDAETAEELSTKLKVDLASAFKNTEADKSKISDLTNNIESLKALREDLENKVKEALIKLSDKDEQIITEKKSLKPPVLRLPC